MSRAVGLLSTQPRNRLHVQAVSAVMTGPGVTTITVSRAGGTLGTVLATRLAKRAGAQTITITRLGPCLLKRQCDVVPNTVANETRFGPEAVSSRVAQLALTDVLVSSVAMIDPGRAVGSLETRARAIAEKRG